MERQIHVSRLNWWRLRLFVKYFHRKGYYHRHLHPSWSVYTLESMIPKCSQTYIHAGEFQFIRYLKSLRGLQGDACTRTRTHRHTHSPVYLPSRLT
ncbi:hypothetical protein J6590_048689 [Homalodisca vitripennis]|nr:hypothetical protein J6590_048689 [Homalodisca vitripennis]